MSRSNSNTQEEQNYYETQLLNTISGSQTITNTISKETLNNTLFNATDIEELENLEELTNIVYSPVNSALLDHHQISDPNFHTQTPNATHKRLMSETSSSKSHPSPTNLTPTPQKHENTNTKKINKNSLPL